MGAERHGRSGGRASRLGLSERLSAETASAGALPVAAPSSVWGIPALSFGRWRAMLTDAGLSWQLLLLAIGLRVLLSQLQHIWDSQTMWDAAAQIGREPNILHAVAQPFERMRELTDLARGSAGHVQFYEYWAYPPGMLLLWWPLARLWTVVAGPLTPQFFAPGTFAGVPMPFLLSLGLKAPIIAGDLACAVMLARAGHPRLARWYLFNPYVLLMGAWTFDAVMVALLLGGLVAAERQHWGWSGILLGLGAGVKFVPALFLMPVCMAALRTSRTPLRSAVLAAITGLGVFAVICAPWWDGVGYVLTFHGSRFGGNMSWQAVWMAIPQIDPLANVQAWMLYLSAQIGFITLSGALLIAGLLIWWLQLELMEASLVLMLAYLVGSKLVNEVYVLPALVLALIVFSRRHCANGGLVVRLLWLFPFVFAIVNGPIWTFFVAPGAAFGLLTTDAARAFHSQSFPEYIHTIAPVLAVAGVVFQLTCCWCAWQVLRLRSATSATMAVARAA